MNPAGFAEAIASSLSDGARQSDLELAEWVVGTCLMLGASVATAYQVAGLFVAGVRQRRTDAPDAAL